VRNLNAESRAHRIGLTKDDKVSRLHSREIVEDILELKRAKGKPVFEHLVFMAWKGMNKTRTERISSANMNSRPFCDLEVRNSSKNLVLLPTMVGRQ
jgi:hypothetical protein